MNENTKKIRSIVNHGLAPALKQAGFQRHSMNFSRQDGEAQVINVQLNRWNSSLSGSFTINVGVDIARVAELLPVRLPMPENPKEYSWRRRVGMLMPDGRDHWWTVTPETKIEEMSEELVNAWTTHIAPWLEKFKTVSSLAGEPDRGAIQNVFTRAVANIVLGDRAKAAQLIAAQIKHIQEDPRYVGAENAKLREVRLAMFHNWAADQGLTIANELTGSVPREMT
jgi:hypothetical protein